MKVDKLIYKIEVITSAIDFQLEINDVKVASEKKGLSFSSQIPVNEWLMNGTNLLHVKIDDSREPFDVSSYVKVRIGTCLAGEAGFNEIYKVEHLKLEENPVHSISHPFVAAGIPVTLSLKDLSVIDVGDKHVLKKLFNSSRNLYELFQSKNKVEILELCRFRMKENDRVNFNLPKTEYDNFADILDRVFSEEIMLKYLESKLSMEISAGGKLISLVYKDHDLPAINSTPNDLSMTRSFMFYWTQNEDKELVIYR